MSDTLKWVTDAPERWMVDYENAEGEPQHAVLSWLDTDPTKELPEAGEVLVRLSDYEKREREVAATFAALTEARQEIAALKAQLVQARDGEARECANDAATFHDFGPSTQCPKCGERDQVLHWYTLGRKDAAAAIERRIQERSSTKRD